MDLLSQFRKLESNPRLWAETFQKLHHDTLAAVKRKKLSSRIAMASDHVDKNRYSNVLPFDQNRIKLRELNNLETDYINASPVMVPEANRYYILSQGPVPESVDDFWQMIFENDVPCIVMLNRLYEGNALKCEKYYPSSDEKVMQFEKFTIHLESEEELDSFTSRKLRAVDSEGTIKELTHIQYTEWPDFGVPESTDCFLGMLNYIKNLNVLSLKESDPPVVVHCSAGIGRSGTFVVVDAILRMIELGVSESDISVHELLTDIRCQRFGLIQTYGQLRFAWQAIIDGIDKPEKEIPADTVLSQDVSKKRRSESQDDPEDRLSKRREYISHMVAKSRAAEAKQNSTGSFVQAVLMGGAVAASAVLAYYLYKK